METDQQPQENNTTSTWVTEIMLYEKEARDWESRAKKILRRYKDKRQDSQESVARYNILWANTQTLVPALYSREPKPDIERRFRDEDPVGRYASDVLQRAASYFVSCYQFGSTMRQAVVDRLLPGRGTAWVRYVPHFRDAQVQGLPEIQDDGVEITNDEDESEPIQEVYYEEVIADYVAWEDFGHSVSRTWEEVYAVWRSCYLTRSELIERFGEEKGSLPPLDYSPKNLVDEKVEEELKKAIIYEIWDKNKKQVYWIHKDVSEPLDVKDDPLKLKDFFPCPKPLYPTLTNDSLIPVPDYLQYQDQAKELDDLTGRIAALTKAVKVVGVFDASAQGIERLMVEGVQNTLIPVESWAVFGEKGGLAGAMQLLPMQEIAQTLLSLYEARDKVKQDLYEITGMSDIMRGASDPSETATAQTIKGQYGSMRLGEMQREVQRFARDLVCIMSEIIAGHFSIDTLKKISGVKMLTNAEKQQIMMPLQQKMMMAQQQPQQPGHPPTPPPTMDALVQGLPEEVQDGLKNPSWEDVDALLKDDAALQFRIDIETDSTIKADQEADKASRIEFLTACSGFIKEAMQVSDPALAPLMAQLLMFGVRAFPIGKELETVFESTIEKLEKEAENPTPKPNPEMQKLQQEGQIAQAKMQQEGDLAKQKMQQDAALEKMASDNDMKLAQMQNQLDINESNKRIEMEAQKEAQKQQQEMVLERLRMQSDMSMQAMQAKLDQTTAVILAHIKAAAQIESSRITAAADDGSEAYEFEKSGEA